MVPIKDAAISLDRYLREKGVDIVSVGISMFGLIVYAPKVGPVKAIIDSLPLVSRTERGWQGHAVRARGVFVYHNNPA